MKKHYTLLIENWFILDYEMLQDKPGPKYYEPFEYCLN